MTNSRARPIYIVKKVTEIVNNSTTFQDDNELFYPMKINKTYTGVFHLYTDSGTTPDFKWQLTAPSGAVIDAGNGDLSTLTPMPTVNGSVSVTNIQQSSVNIVIIPFRCVMSTTAGNLTLQWAQNTQTVEDSKLLVGSLLQMFEEK